MFDVFSYFLLPFHPQPPGVPLVAHTQAATPLLAFWRPPSIPSNLPTVMALGGRYQAHAVVASLGQALSADRPIQQVETYRRYAVERGVRRDLRWFLVD